MGIVKKIKEILFGPEPCECGNPLPCTTKYGFLFLSKFVGNRITYDENLTKRCWRFQKAKDELSNKIRNLRIETRGDK